jgi:hypothetical protein
MVVLEIMSVAGAGYTAYNAWLLSSFYYKAKATGEGLQCAQSSAHGLELYGNKMNYGPPIYINTGGAGSVGIPIGGGIYTTRELVYSRWRSVGNGKNEHYDYLYGSRDPNVVKTWVNTAEELNNLCAQYQIAQGTFPVKLPLRALRFNWSGPVWFDLSSAAISQNRNWVAKKAALARRGPFAFTVAIATVGCLIFQQDSLKKFLRGH